MAGDQQGNGGLADGPGPGLPCVFVQYPKAIAAYESVRPGLAKWIEAQTKVGGSHWKNKACCFGSEDAQLDKEADGEVQKALTALRAAPDKRGRTGVPRPPIRA